jgi:hypothetical protein
MSAGERVGRKDAILECGQATFDERFDVVIYASDNLVMAKRRGVVSSFVHLDATVTLA